MIGVKVVRHVSGMGYKYDELERGGLGETCIAVQKWIDH
jgi:hypothetical protein